MPYDRLKEHSDPKTALYRQVRRERPRDQWKVNGSNCHPRSDLLDFGTHRRLFDDEARPYRTAWTRETDRRASGVGSDIPIDSVRSIRAAATETKNGRVAIDFITRDENIRWLFPTSIDNGQVAAPTAVLAELMSIPDVERDELRRQHLTAIEAGTDAAAM